MTGDCKYKADVSKGLVLLTAPEDGTMEEQMSLDGKD